MGGATRDTGVAVFEVEFRGDTIIVTPVADLGESTEQRIAAWARDVLELLKGVAGGNVVVNCHKTELFGFAALRFFVRLWKLTRGRGGRMAFCNVAEGARRVLRMTELDRLWPVYSSSEEAVEGVGGGLRP
jgi:anti-sigma B factor antagonist